MQRLKEDDIYNGEAFRKGSVKVDIFSILKFTNIREDATGPTENHGLQGIVIYCVLLWFAG